MGCGASQSVDENVKQGRYPYVWCPGSPRSPGVTIRIRLPKDSTFPSVSKLADAFEPFLDEFHTVRIVKTKEPLVYTLSVVRNDKAKLSNLGWSAVLFFICADAIVSDIGTILLSMHILPEPYSAAEHIAEEKTVKVISNELKKHVDNGEVRLRSPPCRVTDMVPFGTPLPGIPVLCISVVLMSGSPRAPLLNAAVRVDRPGLVLPGRHRRQRHPQRLGVPRCMSHPPTSHRFTVRS
jgi:hypothetical protein